MADKDLGATFDTVVSGYDKMRPGYVPELFETIFNYISIGEDSRVVEVGSGSGQATLPVLKTGCELIAAEYGENFSKFLMEKFKDYPKFSVKTGKFEELDFRLILLTSFFLPPHFTGCLRRSVIKRFSIC